MDEQNNQNQWPDRQDDHGQASSPDSSYNGSNGWQNGPDSSPQGGQGQGGGNEPQWPQNQSGGQWQNGGNQWQNSQPGGPWQNGGNQWQNDQPGGQWQNGQNQWQNSQPGGPWQNNENQWQNGGNQWQNNQPYGQPPQRNGQALASMIFGILALVSCCIPFVQFPLAVVTIVLVILSKKKRPLTGFAIAGLVLGIISVICSICMTFYLGYVFRMLNDPEVWKLYEEMMELYQ